MNGKDKFTYAYSAPGEEERTEIESIRRQYDGSVKAGKSKLDRLRALHAKAVNIPRAVALTIGIVGLLIFGLGLTMILEWERALWGIVVMTAGGISMIVAYPVCKFAAKKCRERYGDEILKLSEELLHEDR